MIVILITALCLCSFNDKSPVSRIPWALQDIRIEVIYSCKMMSSALILTFDVDLSFSSIFLIIFLVADILSLLLHMYSPSYLHYPVQIVEITGLIFAFIFSINALIEVVLISQFNLYSQLM